jgi:hypothetical protein
MYPTGRNVRRYLEHRERAVPNISFGVQGKRRGRWKLRFSLFLIVGALMLYIISGRNPLDIRSVNDGAVMLGVVCTKIGLCDGKEVVDDNEVQM